MMCRFLLGVGFSALVVFFFVARYDWLSMPRVWREEPDRNLLPWFRFVRRIFRGGPRGSR